MDAIDPDNVRMIHASRVVQDKRAINHKAE